MSSGISFYKRFTRLYELDNYNSRDQQLSHILRSTGVDDAAVPVLLLTCIMFIKTNCDSLVYH